MRQSHLGQARKASELLSCLSHPFRLIIVCLLLKREMYALEINEQLGTTKGNISQHLKILLSKKLIKGRRAGKRTYYGIRDPRLKELTGCLKRLYCRKLEV